MKYILFFSFLFILRPIHSENFMMNCTSPDFKKTLFFKYVQEESKLFARPMKSKWANFCKKNYQYEEEVECNFSDYKIIRTSIEKKNKIKIKVISLLNFYDFSLKIKNIKDAKNTDEHVEENYRCRKIKI